VAKVVGKYKVIWSPNEVCCEA